MMVATSNDSGVIVNLLVSSRLPVGEMTLSLERRADVFKVRIEEAPSTEAGLSVRVPAWATLGAVRVNGEEQKIDVQNGYLGWRRVWAVGDAVELVLDCPTKVHSKTFTVDHHGQEVVRMDYAYVSKGPFVYATGLIDGFRKEETFRLAKLNPSAPFRTSGDALDLYSPGREPIRFLPYYEAGGRHEGAWRTTWLQVAWQ